VNPASLYAGDETHSLNPLPRCQELSRCIETARLSCVVGACCRGIRTSTPTTPVSDRLPRDFGYPAAALYATGAVDADPCPRVSMRGAAAKQRCRCMATTAGVAVRISGSRYPRADLCIKLRWFSRCFIGCGSGVPDGGCRATLPAIALALPQAQFLCASCVCMLDVCEDYIAPPAPRLDDGGAWLHGCAMRLIPV